MDGGKRTQSGGLKAVEILVRERLEEKRIFEAGFLLGRLGDDITPLQRKQLQQEVAVLTKKAEGLYQQALMCSAKGERETVKKLYQQIEQISIDFHGLAEDKKKLNSTEALADLLSKTTKKAAGSDEEKPLQSFPAEIVGSRKEQKRPSGRAKLRLYSPVVVGGGLVVVGVLALLIFFIVRGAQAPVERAGADRKQFPSQAQVTEKWLQDFSAKPMKAEVVKPEKKESGSAKETPQPYLGSVRVGKLNVVEADSE